MTKKPKLFLKLPWKDSLGYVQLRSVVKAKHFGDKLYCRSAGQFLTIFVQTGDRRKVKVSECEEKVKRKIKRTSWACVCVCAWGRGGNKIEYRVVKQLKGAKRGEGWTLYENRDVTTQGPRVVQFGSYRSWVSGGLPCWVLQDRTGSFRCLQSTLLNGNSASSAAGFRDVPGV